MPREYVESINYEYNKGEHFSKIFYPLIKNNLKVDGQTYINVNVVRPIEKIKHSIESHNSSKLSRAKSSLKSSTGKSQNQNQQQDQDLSEQQQLEELQQQQQQQQQLQQMQQQQQLEYEQQQQGQQEQAQQEGEEYEESEQEQYEEEEVHNEEAQEQEGDHVLPNGRNLSEELIRIEMKKLELKELELRRSEIRDLEQRRNDLLKSITILRRRRGYSSEPIRTLSSLSSRPNSVESVYRSQASRPATHRTKASVKRPAPSATSRPQAPSNYQNGSGTVRAQQSTRTIAQIQPETRNRTVREVSNTDYEPESQTEFERQLNLPTKSHWANAVQNQTNQVWLNGGGFQITPGAFPGQQYGQNYAQNQFNNQEYSAQQLPTQNFAQPNMQQVPNQFSSQQSFGQSQPNVTQSPPFAQNQNFNQNMSQLNQPNFPNQFQQAQMPQMNSSVNFQTAQQNYFQ